MSQMRVCAGQIPKGGRPTRWCSQGCKRSGEDEMSRLSSLLRLFAVGRYVDQLNGRHRPAA
jgi:hypothetical protein